MGASVGGVFVAITVTAKVCVVLNGGEPLSVTITLKKFVPAWACIGVQEKTPLVALMMALVAAPAPRLNVSWSPSGSPATLVTVKVVPALTVRLEIAARVGGWLVGEITPAMVRMPELLVADWLSGLKTVMVRAPGAALPAMARWTVMLVGLL